MLKREELKAAFARLALCKGDLVVVKADLAYLGPIEEANTKEAYLETVYEALRRQIGDEGTMVVPTGTDRLCASGADFILEETSGEMGLFSEYVRKRRYTRRSLHPFGSYAAEGPLAIAITGDVSKNSFGPETPKARLVERQAKVLNIGITPSRTNTIIHHAEQLMGVPYRYHKEFPNRVFAKGEYVGTDYLLFVRRLECNISWDLNRRLFELFHQLGHQIFQVQIAPAGVLTCFNLAEMFETCILGLKKDIYSLLVEPPDQRPYRLTV